MKEVEFNNIGYMALEIRRCCADPIHEVNIYSGSQMKPIPLGIYPTKDEARRWHPDADRILKIYWHSENQE